MQPSLLFISVLISLFQQPAEHLEARLPGFTRQAHEPQCRLQQTSAGGLCRFCSEQRAGGGIHLDCVTPDREVWSRFIPGVEEHHDLDGMVLEPFLHLAQLSPEHGVLYSGRDGASIICDLLTGEVQTWKAEQLYLLSSGLRPGMALLSLEPGQAHCRVHSLSPDRTWNQLFEVNLPQSMVEDLARFGTLRGTLSRGTVFAAVFSPISSGATISGFGARGLRWQHHTLTTSLPHSAYSNQVQLIALGDWLLVLGQESHGNYLEILATDSGELLFQLDRLR